MALLGQLFTVEVGLTGSVWKDLNDKFIAALASKELEIPVVTLPRRLQPPTAYVSAVPLNIASSRSYVP